MTERARKIRALIDQGRVGEAKELVPDEQPYPLPEDLRVLLGMDQTE